MHTPTVIKVGLCNIDLIEKSFIQYLHIVSILL